MASKNWSVISDPVVMDSFPPALDDSLLHLEDDQVWIPSNDTYDSAYDALKNEIADSVYTDEVVRDEIYYPASINTYGYQSPVTWWYYDDWDNRSNWYAYDPYDPYNTYGYTYYTYGSYYNPYSPYPYYTFSAYSPYQRTYYSGYVPYTYSYISPLDGYNPFWTYPFYGYGFGYRSAPYLYNHAYFPPYYSYYDPWWRWHGGYYSYWPGRFVTDETDKTDDSGRSKRPFLSERNDEIRIHTSDINTDLVNGKPSRNSIYSKKRSSSREPKTEIQRRNEPAIFKYYPVSLQDRRNSQNSPFTRQRSLNARMLRTSREQKEPGNPLSHSIQTESPRSNVTNSNSFTPSMNRPSTWRPPRNALSRIPSPKNPIVIPPSKRRSTGSIRVIQPRSSSFNTHQPSTTRFFEPMRSSSTPSTSNRLQAPPRTSTIKPQPIQSQSESRRFDSPSTRNSFHESSRSVSPQRSSLRPPIHSYNSQSRSRQSTLSPQRSIPRTSIQQRRTSSSSYNRIPRSSSISPSRSRSPRMSSSPRTSPSSLSRTSSFRNSSSRSISPSRAPSTSRTTSRPR